MKRLLSAIFLILTVCPRIHGQTKTVITGTIQTPTGIAATSGYVEFRIRPSSSSIAYRVTGTAAIAPQTSRCAINSSGNVVALIGSGSCLLWGNTVIQPASTGYDVVIAPNNTVSSTIQNELISGTSYDLAAPVFNANINLVPQYQTITTAPIAANLVPAANNQFNIGDSGHYYGQGFITTLTAGTINATGMTIPDAGSEVFNVKAYGAKGDGSTDDTTAINAAIGAAGLYGCAYIPSGTYIFTSTILIGSGSATRGHCLIGNGHAQLKANFAAHTTDLIVMKGYNLTSSYYGIQFFPVVLRGFDILAQNTGRDAVVLQESDHPVIEDVRILQPYRDGVVLTPSANNWIENPLLRNVAVSRAGQHCFYLGTINANTFINDGTYINTECRAMAINSVTLGINAGTQPTQLGACIYVISKGGATTGDIDGHTWIAHTCDAGSNYAVANSSQPNPNAVFFADGTTAQVIEGAGVAGSNRNFTMWRFLNPRIEDVAAGGFTTGICWTKQSASVATPNLWIEGADGGNYCALTSSPFANDDGTLVWSAVYPGGIRNLRWGGGVDIESINGLTVNTGTTGRGIIYSTTAASAQIEVKNTGGTASDWLLLTGNPGNTVNGAAICLYSLTIGQYQWCFDGSGNLVPWSDDGPTLGTNTHRVHALNVGTGASTFAAGVSISAGNLGISAGNAVVVGTVQASSTAFSNLPACAVGTSGAMRGVNDSTTITWGANITGGGGNGVLAYCDGTNWTVAAK